MAANQSLTPRQAWQMGLIAHQIAAAYQQQQAMANMAGHWPSVGGGIGSFWQGLGEQIAPPPAIDKKLIEKLKNAEPRKALARVPDGIIPITAWRAWAVTGLRLAGLGSSVGWEPKKKQDAVCTGFGGGHLAPQAECSCGFWAFKSLDILLKAAEAYSPKVIGMVSLWGRIIETENGFRAQHAYPKELWLLDSSLEELGRVYDVPIRTA